MRKWILLFLPVVCVMTAGCAVSGSVIDRGQFETPLKKMRLEEYPALKVYCNGGTKELSLSAVSTVKIDTRESATIGRELYFGTEVTLKDGSRITSGSKGKCYISIQNTITGNNKGEYYKITLDNVSQINVK